MHPLPAPDDAARLAALSEYQILDTSPDAMFDDLARLAAQVCTMPIAAINLIDAERQWFKARVGIDVAEVPRSLGCCPAVIGQPALVIVPDLAQDVRFAATPVVMAGTPLRFYAGMPLRTSEGHALGTLFVADVVPRQLSTAQADALRALARQVVALLDLHRLLVTRTEAADQALQASAARFRALVQHATDVVQVIGIDGITHYISPAAERILGYPPAKLIGQPIFDVIAVHPEDGDRLRALFADLLAHPSVSVTAEVRVQHGEGAWRTLEAVGQNLLADPSVGGIVVNYRDSTDRKQAEAWHAQQVRHAALREAVSTALHASDTVDQVLARCVEAVVRHVDAAFARVWTLNVAAQMLELRASAGLYTHLDGAHCRVPVGRFKIGRIAQERHPHLTNDVLNDPYISDKGWAQREGMVAFAGYPLVVGPRLVGVVALFARHPLGADTLDTLATVADLMAQGIERMGAEAAVRHSEARFRSLVHHASDLILVLDAARSVRYVSPSVERLLGYQPTELLSSTGATIVHPDDVGQAERFLAALHQTADGTPSVQVRARHQDGTWRYLDVLGTNLLQDPSVQGIVLNARDITERRQAEAALEHQALHDALTGLPNRTLVCDRLTQAIAQAKRHPDHRYAVLFLDLDRFKVVNDSLGHPLGDQLLRTAAQRLATCVRAGDTVARLGGDEFVVLLDDITDVREAVEVAVRIQATLAEPFDLAGHLAYISASIGITLSTCPAATADAVLRDADTAMYRAKSAGKARYAVFDAAMHAAVLDRLHLEADLRQAIERDELVLHYQPILALASGQVAGVEALVRWQHPTRGQLPPAAFIPLAEETGLILALGAWVLRTACAQLAAWQAAGLPPMWVAVNLSVRQVQQPGLPTLIADTLAATGLAPHYVQLEITESMLMDAVETTRTTLAEVHALGVRLALDDFGMGYSSLRYLQHLPLDTLKIAQPFVADIVTDPQAAAISAGVSALSQSLGLTVIAEGVETADQVQVLRAQQCDAIQGYLVSHPLPAAAVPQYLQDHAPANGVVAAPAARAAMTRQGRTQEV